MSEPKSIPTSRLQRIAREVPGATYQNGPVPAVATETWKIWADGEIDVWFERNDAHALYQILRLVFEPEKCEACDGGEPTDTQRLELMRDDVQKELNRRVLNGRGMGAHLPNELMSCPPSIMNWLKRNLGL